ncbi:MAG: AAA family ATPase [Holosporaceae bacterium]|jgi:DNA polymerase-3 subunit delta'|nr:AAA family ATPase [Holosporaceae bacterium]
MTYRIFGHEKNEALLARVLTGGNVFPTWIFHGPAGVGKTSIAFKFAKRLLITNDVHLSKGTLDIDPQHTVHGLVDRRIHPDLFVLEQTEGSISIDDVRKLLLRVRMTPVVSKRRVVVLENVSNLNRNIHNSLLKMLEEPPNDTAIIMVCNNLGAIPKTLLSRAAQVYFRSLDTELVRRILEERNVKEAGRLAQLSGGSISYALRLSENNGAEVYNNILSGFSHGGATYQKTLKWILASNLCDNFDIIKASILRILKIYIDLLTGVANNTSNEEKIALEPVLSRRIKFPEHEVRRIQEIIAMIGMGETLALDKSTVIVNAFESFFR